MKLILACCIFLMFLSVPANAEYGWTIQSTMNLPVYDTLPNDIIFDGMMTQNGMAIGIGWHLNDNETNFAKDYREPVDWKVSDEIYFTIKIINVDLPPGIDNWELHVSMIGDGLLHGGYAETITFVPYSAKQIVVTPMSIMSVPDETPYQSNGLFPLFKSVFEKDYK